MLSVLVAANVRGDESKPIAPMQEAMADSVLLNGKIITVDAKETIAQAVAIHAGRIMAVGSNAEIKPLIGEKTTVIDLQGKTVVPGFIEEHSHINLVAEASLENPYVVLSSISEVQDWIRQKAQQVPAGDWIMVPRNDITRLAEHRHPTRAELDAACTTHPVAFNAAKKWVFNTRGFEKLGVSNDIKELAGGRVLRNADGSPRMVVGAENLAMQLMPGAVYSAQILSGASYTAEEESSPKPAMLAAMEKVMHCYNSVGITSITEREVDRTIYGRFRALHDQNRQRLRVTLTFLGDMHTAEAVRKFVDEMEVKPREGDDWLRAGQLKIYVDGGIHWGSTFLREPYGPKRAQFYALDDPNYRGNINYTVEEMAEAFAEGHKLGWQMCCHVTGDAAVDRVLDALEIANQKVPLADRRFTLLHCYFPAKDALDRCKRLGVCAGTHPCIYYKDSDAIAEVYGQDWAERFIGVGDWLHGGVPVSLSSDHMTGLDPDRALNSFNPMLQLYVAVTRKNEHGHVYGPRQKLTRMEALHAVTIAPAYENFNEKSVGSIEAGKLADLAVLDRDYLTCPEDEIREIKVLRTILDGKTVFERK